MAKETAAERAPSIARRLPRLRTCVIVVLGAVLVLWVGPTIVTALGSIDLARIDRPYVLVFLFVWWDAIVPVFPSESLLNTGSTLIAAGDIDLQLWLLIVAGAAGAILGDSTLYWVARTGGRRLLADRVERAKESPRVRDALETFVSSAPLLIVAGRFVPGVRFVVGATMGIERYPYARFLMYSACGGALWSAFNCGFSYLIGSRLGEYAVLSLVISVAVTTAILTVVFRALARRLRETQAAEASRA